MAEEVKGVTPEVAEIAPQIPEAKAEEVEVQDVSKLKSALDKEREANKELRKRAKLADELEAAEAKRKDAELSEMEKRDKRIAELEAREKELGRKDLMRQAADEYGLPPSLAKRLQGETLEELKADAAELAKEIPAKPKVNVSATQVGSDAEPKETYAEQSYRIYHGSNVDPLDPKQAVQLGGGIFLNTKNE
jgi:hypothetical protein